MKQAMLQGVSTLWFNTSLPQHVLGFLIKSNQEILPNSRLLSKYGDYKNKNQDNDISNATLEAS